MCANRRAHIVSDLFDPSRGSEFQVPQVALAALARCHTGPILLWTTRRGSNQLHIQTWLSERGLDNRVELRLVKMKRADAEGHHAKPWHLMLDLTDLYRRAAGEIRPGEFVWKSGQANVLFNLVALLWLRCDILGPLTGLERPWFGKTKGITGRFRCNYALYAAVLGVARQLLGIAHRWGRFRFVVAATSHDLLAMPVGLQSMSVHHPEVDVEDLMKRVQEPPDCRPSGITSGTRLLWAGALIERKNPLLALEVFARALARHTEAKARMIGTGPLYSAVVTALAAHDSSIRGRLTLQEFVSRSEFIVLLDQIDILLVTSVREANSVLVIEALAAGVTVVSTGVSGMLDTVGSSGYLFKIVGKGLVDRAVYELDAAIRFGAKAPPRQSLVQEHKVQRDRLVQMIEEALK
jgi:glycosyltransferase involved in cell wall biosynthesis